MKYNNIECIKCRQEIPKRYYKVQQELASSSMFGFIPLCPDCSRKEGRKNEGEGRG